MIIETTLEKLIEFAEDMYLEGYHCGWHHENTTYLQDCVEDFFVEELI